MAPTEQKAMTMWLTGLKNNRCSSAFNGRAFTLIELLMVVVLLSVIAGLVMLSFGPAYRNVVFRKSAEDLLSTMRYAQSRAVTKRRTHQLQFDDAYSRFWIMQRTDTSDDTAPFFEHISSRWGRLVALPESVKLECDSRTIDFYPDGTIEKVRIYLHSGGRTLILSSAEQRGEIQLTESAQQEI
jgi:type II secretion system protein H